MKNKELLDIYSDYLISAFARFFLLEVEQKDGHHERANFCTHAQTIFTLFPAYSPSAILVPLRVAPLLQKTAVS